MPIVFGMVTIVRNVKSTFVLNDSHGKFEMIRLIKLSGSIDKYTYIKMKTSIMLVLFGKTLFFLMILIVLCVEYNLFIDARNI